MILLALAATIACLMLAAFTAVYLTPAITMCPESGEHAIIFITSLAAYMITLVPPAYNYTGLC